MSSKHHQAPVLISQGIFDSVGNFREFEARVSALFDTNTKAQGDAFEIFVEAYLATQPIQQCEDTWLVGDIPIEIRDTLNLPNDSKGIDGVYKSVSGEYVPYQVKFRSNRPHLGFNEVAPFLGITEKATDRLLITNCDSIAIDVQNRTGIRSLRGVDFDQLTTEDFSVIEGWLKQKIHKRKPINPDPYQIEALANIKKHLEANDRGTVVMACGTGKTLVALWAVEQSKAKSILVLLPSLTLLQQTLEEWSTHNSWGRNFSYLCVCSDPSVNLKNDEIEVDPADVPFRIDTDPEIVKSYLEQHNGKQKIIFSTYQSSQVVSQETKAGFEFDICIFDEAHKTTGPADGRFALALKNENLKIKKRLFLTATPKHYDITKRDKAGEFKFVSMDDEGIYGKRAHTLTFGDAAAKGIICPYKVVITLIDKQQVDDFALKNGITFVDGDAVNAKWVASQIAVSSAIKHTNAKKVITFHSRVKTARDFASDEIYGIKNFVDNFDVYHVHGKQKSNERKDTISKFRNAHRSIISNAKCLTEGVDVPAVDMVAFIDPRHSKIDIAQAVGRAMRKPRGGDKSVGYIVVPIFADSTDDRSLEEAIQSENFDDVALILNALIEQDAELVEIVRDLKVSKGEGAIFNPKRLREKLEVIGPIVGLENLTNSICAQAIDRIGLSWDEWYGKLLKHTAIFGIADVPGKFVDEFNSKLGRWVEVQKANEASLPADKKKLLESLSGWKWAKPKADWMDVFEMMKDFERANGHINFPMKYETESGFKLGRWVEVQKANEASLPADKKKLLESLSGWKWAKPKADWMDVFEMMKDFERANGHINFPMKYETESGFKLGRWVEVQKANEASLPADKKKLLESLSGWKWAKPKADWMDVFEMMKDFERANGHINFPMKYETESGFKLGRWVEVQKANEASLPADKKKLLESLSGWKWAIKRSK